MENGIELTQILEKVYQKLCKEISDAYSDGKINEVLEKYDLKEKESFGYCNINSAKILIIGDSSISKEIMLAIAAQYGIDKKRIDFELDYNKLTNYNFKNLQYSMVYSDILVGPIPHKVKGIEEYSSFLAKVESNPEEYPNLIRLQGSNGLKITKESFRNGLKKTRIYESII